MDKKTLGLTVYKYPENKFPHDRLVMICYEEFNRINYQIARIVYPAIDQPNIFNKDYFEFRGIRHGYSSERVIFNLVDWENISWCKISDITDGMNNTFKEITINS